MGACACKNLGLKDDAVIEQGKKNLIITIDETQLKEERAKAVKAFRTELGNKLKSTLRNFGEIVTEEEFNEKIPQHISEYSESYPFTEKYEDDMNNLLEEGPIKLVNGNYYWGYWNENCQMEGPGKLFLTNDKVFVTGFWKGGNLYRGRIHFPDCVYEGEIENNVFNGQGKVMMNDGSYYEGEFVKGKKEGNGKYKWPDNSNYWGEFVNDDIDGKGEFNWINGYSYNGEHKRGVFNGFGILKSPNGSVYSGNFKNGLYHGKGNFTWTFQNNNNEKVTEKYCGNYGCGKKEGNGRYIFQNGDLFSGTWFEGKPHGEGEYETGIALYRSFWRSGQMVEKPTVEFKEENNAQNNEIDKINFDFEVKKEDIDFTQLPGYINRNELGSSII